MPAQVRAASVMDKAVAKSVLRDHGLPVVPSLAVTGTEWRTGSPAVLRRVRRALPLPVFAKPSNLGSCVGITKVTAAGGVAAALDLAFRYDATALVEKGITGRELECSVLGNESPEASLAGEVIPFREFYDYKDKYYIDSRTRFAIPAELPARSMARVRALAVAAFKALAASGMARVDFFLEKGTNRLYINELNTIPGFTEISMYPKLWEVSGLPFPRLLERLIELGCEHHAVVAQALEQVVDAQPAKMCRQVAPQPHQTALLLVGKPLHPQIEISCTDVSSGLTPRQHFEAGHSEEASTERRA